MRTLVWFLGLAGCDLPDGVELPDTPTADRMGSPSFGRPRERATRIRTCRVTSENEWEDWTWVYVLDRKGQPIEATARAADGAQQRQRWEREYDANGDVERVERAYSLVRNGIEEVLAVDVYTYVEGRLATYGTDQAVRDWYEWDSEGRLTFWESTDDRWTGTWDADGHLVREEYDAIGTIRGETIWTWDGDRLVRMLRTSRDMGETSITWNRWDGDLPAHGTVERWSWDGHLQVQKVWEETWTWDNGLPTLYASTYTGTESVLGAWSWEDDRLLEATTGGGHSVWTWDADDRVQSLETERGNRASWTWDGDRLAEVGWSGTSGSGSEQYGAGCPPEAWSRTLPLRGASAAPSPLPRVRTPRPVPW